MKKIFKSLFVIFLSLVCVTLVACRETPPKPAPEPEWDKMTIQDVELVEESITPEYEYDEFKYDLIKLHITYTNGMDRTIGATEEMFDSASIKKMARVGSPRVTLVYEVGDEAYDFTFIIHLIDSAQLDQNLNEDGDYDCVVKAIRDKSKDEIMFICDPTKGGITSFQFEYVYDNNIMILSNFKQNEKLQGVFSYEIKEGSIAVTIILDKGIDAETTLFTVGFTGNFRTSGLKINEKFNNATYAYEAGEQPVKYSTLYHASIK